MDPHLPQQREADQIPIEKNQKKINETLGMIEQLISIINQQSSKHQEQFQNLKNLLKEAIKQEFENEHKEIVSTAI